MTPLHGQRDVFVSYASSDRDRVVAPILGALDQRGISYWVDSHEMRWGTDIVAAIESGLRSAETALVVFSTAYVDAPWARREYSALVSMEIRGEGARILPLVVGDDDEIAKVRAAFPLVHSRLFHRWVNDADETARKIADVLSQGYRMQEALRLDDEEMLISTAFWAGRFNESVVRSQTLLELALARRDYETAALGLANLILIARSRGQVGHVRFLLQRYMGDIPVRRLSAAFEYRLMKELFVYYYEQEAFDLSARYLTRMERLDSELMTFTPSDDWIPGTVRWRKAHLLWMQEPTRRRLREGLAVAQDGVTYLTGVLRENPNSAGLASAILNVGWLYVLAENPVALDYFAMAQEHARGFSPRTRSEAELGEIVAMRWLRVLNDGEAESRARGVREDLRRLGFPPRTYAFLGRVADWPVVRRLVAGV
ncbi:toll/interleukin-1 receptor domain-containing protein [Miltoncostaea oceani]|uniref:toll/interleukin-1 receptor domain-containing protein n=1 Tax=Miltoncostaea oceani TaxID=2843216 RepID=UPI001C3D02A3|nr:toll/interleukin-1 receptor domain-containing protein [Miltoncostaea oceani]